MPDDHPIEVVLLVFGPALFFGGGVMVSEWLKRRRERKALTAGAQDLTRSALEADWHLIDLFRVIRAAGRSDRAKAQAAAKYVAEQLCLARRLK